MTDHPYHDQVDLYVDDALDEPSRHAFEQAMADDPALRSAVERQHHLDASLARQFDPGDGASVIERINAEAQRMTAASNGSMSSHGDSSHGTGLDLSSRSSAGNLASSHWVRRLAVAAVLALGVFGIWQITQTLIGPGNPYPPPQWASMASIYARVDDAGRTPDWVCETDREFANTFWLQFRAGVLLDDETPDDVVALGLSMVNTISEKTIVLLSEVEGELVLVFVDRKDMQIPADVTELVDAGLRLHTRETEHLRMYEVSPLETIRVAPYLNEIEMPPGWVPDRGEDQ